MEMKFDQNMAFYVGIDAHREEHTAVMATRLEEEKGSLTFTNTSKGIEQFLFWLRQNGEGEKIVIGIEGGGRTRNALISSLLTRNYPVFEVNPLYTKQRRDYGTRGDKSDILDAKLVVEVLTRKLNQLPRLCLADYSSWRLALTKTVKFYEELACQRARLKNQLGSLVKEKELMRGREEKETLNLIIGEKRKDLRRIIKLETKVKQKLSLLLESQGNNLTTMKGIATVLAAKILAQTGDITKFANINKFIKYAGIAPLEKSSGKTKRHHQSRTGNRKLNSAFYLLALNQLRWNNKAKEYFQKKIREGKTKKQALRCLMKRIACIVYGLLKSGEYYRG